MRGKYKPLVRIVALVLAALLLVGAVVAAVLSSAEAETGALPARDSYVLEVEFLEDAQALQITQRLVYTNRTGETLDRVEFSVYGNMFRRESALMYKNDALLAAFADGYAPGGLEFSAITVDGRAADWGMVGENELFLRVACALAPDETCEFGFDYTLLLTRNGAFLGVGDTDWRLRNFYVQALKYEYGEFVAPAPIQHANYVYADRADYTLRVTLPDRYLLAGPGEIVAEENGGGARKWTLTAKGLRELALSWGMRWRESTGETALGTRVTVLSNRRDAAGTLKTALETLNFYEGRFGALSGGVTIAQSDYALEALPLEGLVWVASKAMDDAMTLRRALAKQFFGYGAYAMPTEDAWLSDSLCEYVAYLALEDAEGHEAFLTALSRDLLPTVQYTLPGGLEITGDASMFTAGEYETIVKKRGALVLHELRASMGLDAMLDGLRRFYKAGLSADVLGEYDLVDALDAADGGSWKGFLTDWLFNISDYYEEGHFDSLE